MSSFGIFVIMALIPFAVGFATTGLLRRWWALLAVAAIVLPLGIYEYGKAATDNGPLVAVGILLAWFFVLGTSTGIVSSSTVMIGRFFGLTTLRPALAIPVILSVGFGCPTVFYFFQFTSRDWNMSSPGRSCIDRHYAARIGDIDLSLPAAPGITISEKVGYRSFGLWHNPDLRYLCSRSEGEKLEIKKLSFMVRASFWSTHEAKDVFCSRPRPEYPWAEWVCDPKAGYLNMPDRPSSVSVKTVDRVASSRDLQPVPQSPMVTSSDVSTAKRPTGEVVVFTSEGDRVECGRPSGISDLYCSGDGSFSEGLAISYSFWAAEKGIERTIPTMAAAARGYVRSVVQ